jgi:hypothetical protein
MWEEIGLLPIAEDTGKMPESVMMIVTERRPFFILFVS